MNCCWNNRHGESSKTLTLRFIIDLFTAVEWRREEGGGRRGTAVPSHVPRPNHAGRKNVFFFFSEPASSKLNGHLVLVTRKG
jgi:hypothetical protein